MFYERATRFRRIDGRTHGSASILGSRRIYENVHPPPRRRMVGLDSISRARVLDYGCAYGRTLRGLADRGCYNSIGYDISEQMIVRENRENVDLDLRHLSRPPIPQADGSFDVALILAVLTCIPDDQEQEAVISELVRVLRPGGMLFLSDMPLQTDDRNQRRYDHALAEFPVRGVFRTDDGAVVRHHTRERLSAQLAGMAVIELRSVRLSTMNGHPVTAVQIMARKPGDLEARDDWT